MRQQNTPTNEYPESWDCGTYQTGVSKPKKSQSVLITLLLMAVILLGGLASVLGVMNVRLLSKLVQQQEAVLPLSLDNSTVGAQIDVRGNESYSVQRPGQNTLERQLGFRVREINEFCRKYWKLNGGLEVIAVTDSECSLQEGDILVCVDGQELTDASQLYDAIDRSQTGGSLRLQILRGRQSFTVELTVEERS